METIADKASLCFPLLARMRSISCKIVKSDCSWSLLAVNCQTSAAISFGSPAVRIEKMCQSYAKDLTESVVPGSRNTLHKTIQSSASFSTCGAIDELTLTRCLDAASDTCLSDMQPSRARLLAEACHEAYSFSEAIVIVLHCMWMG